MRWRQIVTVLIPLTMMFLVVVVLNTWTQDTLSKEEIRFDLNKGWRT